MKLKRLLCVYMISALFGCGTEPVGEGEGSGKDEEDVNDVPVELSDRTFLGFNGRSTEGPSWTDDKFLSLVDKVNPACLRYPGGTQANSWDWQTGTLVYKQTPYIFKIEHLVKGLPENTEIVYVMNMVQTPERVGVKSPLTDTSEEALRKKIDDALLALEEFSKHGRLPMAVELGNEFYFANEHAAFYGQNPELYISHVKIICEEIHKVYPDMKIAIVATKGGTKGRDAWNEVVYKALTTDESLKKHVYSVVQHHYISENTGDVNLRITDAETAQKAVAEAFDYMESVKKDYDDVPEGYKLWITEFGVTKYSKMIEEGMWPIGLSYAAMLLSWLEMGEKIDCYMMHHVTMNPTIINTDHMKLGPASVIYREIIKLMDGCKSIESALLSEGRVRAWMFSNEERKRMLLMNTKVSSVDGVDVSSLLGGKTYSCLQYYAPEIVRSPIMEDDGIEVKSVDGVSSIDMEPLGLCIVDIE